MRRVEGVDAAFLAGETPEWNFSVSVLQVIDPRGVEGFGFDSFRMLMERRLHLIPQFRWKLIGPPLGIGWSYFVDDPDLDLDDHVHHVALPTPGDREELGRLVGDLISRRLDRDQPLWEVWFIEGLAGGRAAVLSTVHHSIIDGQSGVDVAAALYDLAPGVPDLPEPPRYEPAPPPSWIEVSARNGLHAASLPLQTVRFGRQLVEQGWAALPFTFGKHPPARPFQAPRTPFNGQLSPHRCFASAVLPLDRVKEIKNAAGVKVNDVVLAVCAGALRSFLEATGELPDKPLIAQVPVSTRTDSSRSGVGTQVGSMFVSLATDVEDPAERLRAVRESSDAGKQLRGTMAQHRSLGLSDTIPPALFGVAARVWSMAHLDARTPPIYNVIISNVAGPPVDFYIAGARVEAMHPMGPLLYGGGLNITVFSNGATIDVGIVTCRELIPDPWTIADRFGPALDELAGAVVPPPSRPRRKASR